MNYSYKILDNKIFNVIKELIKNVAIALCIVLAGCLILVYVFGFRPYKVLTPSMTPVLGVNDMVIVKSQKEYKVGDILTFSQSGAFDKVTHRLVAIAEDNQGVKWFICHGDATQSVNPENGSNTANWRDDVAYLETLTNEDLLTANDNDSTNNKLQNVQYVKASQIEGKVVNSLDNWGLYINEIANHKLLLIGMIIAIWCVTETVQNEIDMKRALRLL